jgi:hypothetical protein
VFLRVLLDSLVGLYQVPVGPSEPSLRRLLKAVRLVCVVIGYSRGDLVHTQT